MERATKTTRVNGWLHEHLAMKTPVKLLGGLALGALVAVAIALPFRTTYTDEPARPLSSEQIQCYPEDVVLGWCYGFAATSDPALTTDATIEFLADLARMYAGLDEMVPSHPDLATGTSVSGVQFEEWPEDAWRFDSPYYDDFLADVAASPSSIDLNEVWTEIEDTPVHHLMKQLKASSPPSINGITCYPEDNC